MDFIESWFGMNPDGGDGTFELLLLLGVAVLAATASLAWVPALRRHAAALYECVRAPKNV